MVFKRYLTIKPNINPNLILKSCICYPETEKICEQDIKMDDLRNKNPI